MSKGSEQKERVKECTFGMVSSHSIDDAEYKSICDEFKRKAEGEGTGGSTEFKKDRFLTFVASTETVDSYGDILRVDGCDLSRFKSGACAFITSHDIRDVSGSSGVIVKAWKVKNLEGVPEGKAVMVMVYFPTEEEDEDADYVFKKYKAGTLKAVSVGLRVMSYNDPQDEKTRKELGLGKWGIEVTKWQPYELSAVTVGANPDALVRKSIEEKRLDSLEESIKSLTKLIETLVDVKKEDPNVGKLNADKVRTYLEEHVQVKI